jgi:L-galactose dehydrogenase
VTRSVEASLQRLRTDYLDVLIAHDVEFAPDFEAVFTETAEVLHKLKRQGKCRFIGMSGLPLGILARAIEQCNLDVVISYCHFTLQNTRLQTELLPIAERHGVGVLNASPLAMGLLTMDGPPDWHPAPPELKAACREAAEVCRKHGADLATLGMQFVFTEPRIASTITGAARVEELERNVQALDASLSLTLLREVQKVLAPVRDMTWPSGNWK